MFIMCKRKLKQQIAHKKTIQNSERANFASSQQQKTGFTFLANQKKGSVPRGLFS